MPDSLARSLADAAAEEARKVFFGTIVGYVGTLDGKQYTFRPEEIQLVTADTSTSLWEGAVRAAVDKAMVAHADHLMATAADLYRVARDIREGR